MTAKFDVIFDNGGGTTLQVGKRGFVHHYAYAAQAARDVEVLLETGNTNGWDGNEPEMRTSYDHNAERSGSYRWHSQNDVKRIIKAGVLSYQENFGRNSREFYEALGVAVED